MADTVLDAFAKFCKALIVAFWYKDRIVAEACCTMLLCSYATVNDTFESVYLLDACASAWANILLLYQRNNCAETSLTVVFAFEIAK